MAATGRRTGQTAGPQFALGIERGRSRPAAGRTGADAGARRVPATPRWHDSSTRAIAPGSMAYSKPQPKRPMPTSSSGVARALAAVFGLFFAFDRPPRSPYERHYIRARAGFFFLLGAAVTL